MTTMRASLIISAVDRASGVFGRIRASSQRLAGGFRPVATAAQGADRAIDRIGTGTEGRFARIRAAARRMADGGFKVAERGAFQLGKGIGSLIRMGGQFALKAAGWAAAAAGIAAGAFSIGIISRAAKLEQLSVELERIEGSGLAAKRGLDWVRNFAETSVVPLDELQAAFVAARKGGIDPVAGAFAAVIDMSLAAKRPIEDVTEALRQAKLGDFGGLEALDIKASVRKGEAFFTFLDKQGKRVVRTTRDNARDIERALTAIFVEKAGGAGERQAKTLLGMWSQIKNMASGFQLDVANAGIFDLIKRKAEGLLSRLQALAKDGSLKRWAETASNFLEKMVVRGIEFAEGVDWAQAGRELATIASAVGSLVSFLARAIELAQKLKPALDLLKFTNPVQMGIDVLANMPSLPSLGGGAKPRPTAPIRGPAMRPLQGGNPWARPQGRQTSQVGGKIEIEVKAAPGTSARTTGLASANPAVPVTVASRGRVGGERKA